MDCGFDKSLFACFICSSKNAETRLAVNNGNGSLPHAPTEKTAAHLRLSASCCVAAWRLLHSRFFVLRLIGRDTPQFYAHPKVRCAGYLAIRCHDLITCPVHQTRQSGNELSELEKHQPEAAPGFLFALAWRGRTRKSQIP